MQIVAPGPIPGARRWGVQRAEWIAIAVLLLGCNWHLAQNVFPGALALLPEKIMAGELWRWLTHAFAHLSWYHLCVDASAFLLLYPMLGDWPMKKRLAATITAIMGSAIAALADPRLSEIGLCGLSGCAHGLMALVALDGLQSSDIRHRRLASFALAGVVFKCVVEAATGGALFANWHLGAVGVPIVACHAGGVIGALAFHLTTKSLDGPEPPVATDRTSDRRRYFPSAGFAIYCEREFRRFIRFRICARDDCLGRADGC
jgi:rhomboid family GlyGly-CTERM serine protease